MSFLRRRTSSATDAEPAAAADRALTAPLLAREASDNDDDDDADHALAITSPSSSSPSSSLAALLWQALVASPVAAALSLLLAPLLPPRWRPLSLSPDAQRALDALRRDAARPFDPASPGHEADLKELWSATFGGGEGSSRAPPPYPPGGRSPLWKEAGWQGEDPRTDLRGGGRGALTAALHMRREQPLLWARLREKKRGGGGAGGENPWVAPEGLEYPFGAAGVNVAFMVSQVAGLHSHDAESGAAAKAASAASAASASAASAAAASSTSSAAATAAAAAAGSVSEGGRGRGPAPSKGPPRTAAAKGFAALLAASAPEEGEGGGGGLAAASDGGTSGGRDNKAVADNGGDADEEEDPHAAALRLGAWGVFGDVYCAAFEALDDEWCARRASYLDFPAVMAATRARLERALASRRAADARGSLRQELRRLR